MHNLLFITLIFGLIFLSPAYADINADLIKAVKKGDINTIQNLLDKGANANVEDQEGRTALEVAAIFNHVEPKLIKIIELFLEKGADSNSKNKALYVVDRSCDEMTAELLINAGAKRDKKKEFYKNEKLYDVATRGNIEEVKTLLSQGADPNMMHTCGAAYGTSPLMNAAYEGHINIVKVLLEKGAKVNTQGGIHYDWTALIHAAFRGHTEIVKVLINAGADVNIVSHDYKETALYGAIDWDYTETVKILLKAGAKITVRDFFVALYKGKYEIVKSLIDYGANVNAVHNDSTTLKAVKERLNSLLDTTIEDKEYNLWKSKQIKEYKKIIELLKKTGVEE